MPDGWKVSAGQVALPPVQFSALSQMPAEGRHTLLEVRNWQFVLQHEPASAVSHCSPLSMTPLPQRLTRATFTKWPSLVCVRLGVPG